MFELTENQKYKIQGLLKDGELFDALKKVFLSAYLERSSNADVQVLAASRIAVTLLNEAFKDLEHYRNLGRSSKSESNPAL